MSNKFLDNVLAEAGYTVAGQGFAQDEAGSSTEGPYWAALVTISPVILRNLGEDDLADRLANWIARKVPHEELEVVITEGTDGIVLCEDFALTNDDHGMKNLARAWDEFYSAVDQPTDEELTEQHDEYVQDMQDQDEEGD